MKKKVFSLLLAASLTLGLIGCGTNGTDNGGQKVDSSENQESQKVQESQTSQTASESGDSAQTPAVDKSAMSYDELSAYVYDEALSEFLTLYEDAKACNEVAKRYALMAIAEAKLMESGVLLPTTSAGGVYVMSRVAPFTVDYTMWGTDYERYHQALVCTEMIKNSDRLAMKAKWNELRGTGEYEAWAKQYLIDQGYTIKDNYIIAYNADPTNWDVLSTYLASDSSAIVNTYDGLYEYDVEGFIQPALATSYDVSENGTVYTFHLRQGVMWVDSQGRNVAEVTADDFVAGMQHLLDAQGGLEYLAGASGCNIVNADAYIAGEVTDFAEVGVKAKDTYTVEYTLSAPCTFFDTMLGYSVFAPLCRTFYESMGGKFGAEYDPSAADYNYGTSPNTIAYCGPYLVTNATEGNTIVFKANPTYWNADHINVKNITWVFNDTSDVTKSYNDAIAGNIDSVGLSTATIEIAKSDNLFDEYAYVSGTDACSYVVYYNLNRTAFANFNDDTRAVSPQSEEDAARTNAAINNVHFRRAISFAVDRASYNGQDVGEALKNNSLRNSYTPGKFVMLPEAVTVSINGAEMTFEKGTYYGQIMQAQLDADGVPILVWNPAADDGNGSGDGYDGWYNPQNAKAELETAIAELAAAGVTVDASNPIYLDYPYPISNERYSNRANAYKKSLEESLDGKVIVNLVGCVDLSDWYYCGYYAGYGYEANYDMYDLTGWIPDFGDPCSYLDTMLPDYAGYMTKCLGIY